MALNNGTATDPYSGRPAYYLRLYVWRHSVDVPNNRSRWSWWLRAYNPSRSKLTYHLDQRAWSAYIVGTSRSGSHNLDFRGGQEYLQLDSGTTGWVNHGTTGGLGVTYSASHGPAGVFGTASLSGSFSADVIPLTPSGLTITRDSDAQHTLNWTRNSTYTSVVVQRRTNSGSWQQVGVANGNAFTFTDTTTQSNRRYDYRVAGRAAAGQSPWSSPVTVYTTPSAPSGVSAVRSGDDIVVSVSNVPPYATSFDVQDDGTTVATGVSLPWTHVSPNPAEPHRYRVRAKRGSLASSYSSYSNTVQLISPPNAPGGLSPNGKVAPSDTDVTFKWVHNPVDSSAQSAYELRHRAPEGSWTVLTGTTASSRAVSLGVGGREWQVRTKGAHPTFSDWSSVATVTVVDRPGVAVLSPTGTWDASVLPVSWSWFQPQGRPQSSWQVELVDSDSNVVESRAGSGAATSVTLNYRLTEGFWTVRVRGATGDVWSPWGEETFQVTFDPPGEPVITGVWDETQGGVGLQVAAETYGVAVFVDGVWYAEVGE